VFSQACRTTGVEMPYDGFAQDVLPSAVIACRR
jgi:hypothetical protein